MKLLINSKGKDQSSKEKWNNTKFNWRFWSLKMSANKEKGVPDLKQWVEKCVNSVTSHEVFLIEPVLGALLSWIPSIKILHDYQESWSTQQSPYWGSPTSLLNNISNLDKNIWRIFWILLCINRLSVRFCCRGRNSSENSAFGELLWFQLSDSTALSLWHLSDRHPSVQWTLRKKRIQSPLTNTSLKYVKYAVNSNAPKAFLIQKGLTPMTQL